MRALSIIMIIIIVIFKWTSQKQKNTALVADSGTVMSKVRNYSVHI